VDEIFIHIFERRIIESLRFSRRELELPGNTILKKAGIIFLVFGLFITLYSTFIYVMRERIADSGKIEITKNNSTAVNWQPYVGVGMVIIGGVVLILSVNRKDEEEINDQLK
jgi:hypothetical protein